MSLDHLMKMSRVVKNNQRYLQLLIKCPCIQRKYLLETASPEQVHAIVQAAHNMCRGYIPLTIQEKEALMPFKQSILDLENPETPFKTKKKILIQEGGSFIPDLLVPFLSGLMML